VIYIKASKHTQLFDEMITYSFSIAKQIASDGWKKVDPTRWTNKEWIGYALSCTHSRKINEIVVWLFRSEFTTKTLDQSTRDIQNRYRTSPPEAFDSFWADIQYRYTQTDGGYISFCEGYLCCFQHDLFLFQMQIPTLLVQKVVYICVLMTYELSLLVRF